ALNAAGEFVAAIRPALVPFADPIGGQLRFGGKRLGAMVFGATLRPITETKRRAIVPPAARVVGHSIKDFITDVRVFEADADQLHQVLRREPDREPAPVGGYVAHIADANAGDAQPMLERIERAQRLPECLPVAFAGIGAPRASGR